MTTLLPPSAGHTADIAHQDRTGDAVPDLLLRSTDGTSISVARTGSGPPLVLCHGSTGSKDSWSGVAPILGQHHTVYRYDRRGRGASGDAEEYSLAQEVDDLHVVLSLAGADAHLVAHSFGGLCALEAARAVGKIRSLVLYEPPVHAAQLPEALQAVACIEAGSLEDGLSTFLSAVGVADEELDFLRSLPHVWARLLEGARSLPREVQAAHSLAWQPDRYADVDAPTLLLQGSLTEAAVYLTIDELQDAIPHAEVREIRGQRHLAFAFAPELFAEAVLRFTTRDH